MSYSHHPFPRAGFSLPGAVVNLIPFLSSCSQIKPNTGFILWAWPAMNLYVQCFHHAQSSLTSSLCSLCTTSSKMVPAPWNSSGINSHLWLSTLDVTVILSFGSVVSVYVNRCLPHKDPSLVRSESFANLWVWRYKLEGWFDIIST